MNTRNSRAKNQEKYSRPEPCIPNLPLTSYSPGGTTATAAAVLPPLSRFHPDNIAVVVIVTKIMIMIMVIQRSDNQLIIMQTL